MGKRVGAGDVVLIHIFAREPRRAAAFYEALFGWSLDADGLAFRTPGGLRGVFRPGEPSTAGPAIYVGVHPLDDVLRRANALGAQTIVRPGRGPDGGRVAQVLDPEGNRIGLSEAPGEAIVSGDLVFPWKHMV